MPSEQSSRLIGQTVYDELDVWLAFMCVISGIVLLMPGSEFDVLMGVMAIAAGGVTLFNVVRSL